MAIRRIRSSQFESSWKDGVIAVSSVFQTGPNINVNAAPNLLDGASLSAGSRVLLRHQTDQTENGIWEVVTPGTGSDGVWKRPDDYLTGERVPGGVCVLAVGGNHGGQVWHVTTNSINGFVVDTDATNWSAIYNYEEIERAGHETEDLSSQVDGTNVTFVLTNGFYAQSTIPLGSPFQYSSIDVYLNGVQLQAGTDYGHDGVDTVTLAFPPKAAPGNPDILRVNYIAPIYP